MNLNLTEKSAAGTTLESTEGLSLSSGGRRGLGRRGSFCLFLACASAVEFPSKSTTTRDFPRFPENWRELARIGETVISPNLGCISLESRQFSLASQCEEESHFPVTANGQSKSKVQNPKFRKRCG